MIFSRSPWRISSRAPHIGEHQEAIVGVSPERPD
jgi:hypothetical protein